MIFLTALNHLHLQSNIKVNDISSAAFHICAIPWPLFKDMSLFLTGKMIKILQEKL